MSDLVSGRAEHTGGLLVLPAALDESGKYKPGMLMVGFVAGCVSILALFISTVIAYYWRSVTPPLWAPVEFPNTLWLSTAIIAASSVTFEIGRRKHRVGEYRPASRMFVATACLGGAFLAAQASAWLQLVRIGAFLAQNPHSSFFYVFTGLHAAHLVGGLIALFAVALRSAPRRELVDVTVYYWHLLGILWAGLFAALRLIK